MTARDDIDWDELRKMLEPRDDKKVALPEPALPGNPSSPFPAQRRDFYSGAQLESYAAARVAEATADQSSELEALNENEKDIAVAQAVEFAQYVVDHAKGRMVEAAERFLALPYSQDVARRMAQNCDELQRRVAELEANDRRYRFLRDKCKREWQSDMDHDRGAPSLDIDFSADGWDLDAAIDAIIADREGGKA